jgi:hypothetical protein
VGPGQTEDLDLLTDAMTEFGFPGFEHNFGLWYDRRRDEHDTVRRPDSKVVAPYLEQPWSRSNDGLAWDGLSKYDLEEFNDWYFERLREFAAVGESKGTVLLFNFYMQHALLENEAHYVDFPWRPVNAIQDTGMPDGVPAANAFYDISDETRRNLHRIYIEKCLDELGDFSNVIFLLSQEYTGPLKFVQFWLDTILEWEQRTGNTIKIGLGATKDVMDEILSDPDRGGKVSVIDLRYWWILPDGSLYAPRGGQQIAGRFAGGYMAAKTTPTRIYEQTLNYRTAFPERAILHTVYSDLLQTWAFLMAGGSLLVRPMDYPPDVDADQPHSSPASYPKPWEWQIMEPIYTLAASTMAEVLPTMSPCPERVNSPLSNWCLSSEDHGILIYAQHDRPLEIDVSDMKESFKVKWFDPKTGLDSGVTENVLAAHTRVLIDPPSNRDWILWLHYETN